MKASEVEVTFESGIALVSLMAPERRNALTPSMAESLVSAFDQIDSDPAVGAAVLYGAGGYFCSGADLSTLGSAQQDPAHSDTYAQMGSLYGSFLRVGQASVPTISAVEGGAVGAGLNLMLATHLRVIAHDAKVLSGFGRVGLHPGGGHFSLLMRGQRGTAAGLGIFGQTISGTECVDRGIAWCSVAEGRALEVAMDCATQVSRDPELARELVQTFKLEVDAGTRSWEAASQLERSSQMWSMRRVSK